MADKKKPLENDDPIMDNLHEKAKKLKKRHAETSARLDKLNREVNTLLRDKPDENTGTDDNNLPK